MADEYIKCALVLPEFNLRVATANPELYPTGITGYEQYYYIYRAIGDSFTMEPNGLTPLNLLKL
jgi:hypothetical protein